MKKAILKCQRRLDAIEESNVGDSGASIDTNNATDMTDGSSTSSASEFDASDHSDVSLARRRMAEVD